VGSGSIEIHWELPPVWAIDVLKSGSSMSEFNIDSENITEAIEQENATSISKIRSLFVDPGFPALQSEDAGSAVPSENMTESEE
jgi:hypothetical protein